MVFSSPVFIFLFLPICLFFVLIAAPLRTRRFRADNIVLMIMSLVFYLYGSGDHLLILLGVTFSSYLFGWLISRLRRCRKLLAGLGVALPLLVLARYRYTTFFLTQAASLAKLMNWPQPEIVEVLLPIGISFFTFQALTYVIDVYRKEVFPVRNFFDLLLYVSMFPQLIAGPIVRYSDVAVQIYDRRLSLEGFSRGAVRFGYGLAKKVLIADACGEIADAVFGLNTSALSSGAALLGPYAYMLQIYFDFSAYSDMAIGMGRMMGFVLPENFDRPYSSRSVTEFWRRWHMTLSFWFRDYVYIPLGGSRRSPVRTYFNLWSVFLLTGLWHGPSWTFVIWGAYHGLILSIERASKWRNSRAADKLLGRVLMLLCVYIGWILFRSESLSQFTAILHAAVAGPHTSLPVPVWEKLTHKNIALLAIASLSLLYPRTFVTGRWLETADGKLAQAARIVVVTLVLYYTAIVMCSGNFNPFIYFQF